MEISETTTSNQVSAPTPPAARIPAEWDSQIRDLYVCQEWTRREIAQQYGVSVSPVVASLTRLNAAQRPQPTARAREKVSARRRGNLASPDTKQALRDAWVPRRERIASGEEAKPGPARRLSETDELALVAMYATSSLTAVAAHFDVSVGTVHGVLVRHGVPRRARGAAGQRELNSCNGRAGI
jgi:transposase